MSGSEEELAGNGHRKSHAERGDLRERRTAVLPHNREGRRRRDIREYVRSAAVVAYRHEAVRQTIARGWCFP